MSTWYGDASLLKYAYASDEWTEKAPRERSKLKARGGTYKGSATKIGQPGRHTSALMEDTDEWIVNNRNRHVKRNAKRNGHLKLVRALTSKISGTPSAALLSELEIVRSHLVKVGDTRGQAFAEIERVLKASR